MLPSTVAQLIQCVREGNIAGAQRIASDLKTPGQSLDDPSSIYRIMKELTLANQEEVWVLYATRRNKLLRKECLFRGGATASIVDVSVLLRKVLLSGAAAFVVVHNHPSGDATPSVEDENVTKSIRAGAKAIGVELLDHVIVATGGCSSVDRA